MREDRERRPDQRHRRNGARKMEEGGWGKGIETRRCGRDEGSGSHKSYIQIINRARRFDLTDKEIDSITTMFSRRKSEITH